MGLPKRLSRPNAPSAAERPLTQLASVPVAPATRVPVRVRRARGIPVFLMAQTQCMTCGREVFDPLTLEEWGRFCSARCYYGHGLPPLRRQGA